MGPQGYSKPGPPGNPGPPGLNGAEGQAGNPGNPGPHGVCDPSMCYSSMMRRDPYNKGPNYWRHSCRHQFQVDVDTNGHSQEDLIFTVYLCHGNRTDLLSVTWSQTTQPDPIIFSSFYWGFVSLFRHLRACFFNRESIIGPSYHLLYDHHGFHFWVSLRAVWLVHFPILPPGVASLHDAVYIFTMGAVRYIKKQKNKKTKTSIIS